MQNHPKHSDGNKAVIQCQSGRDVESHPATLTYSVGCEAISKVLHSMLCELLHLQRHISQAWSLLQLYGMLMKDGRPVEGNVHSMLNERQPKSQHDALLQSLTNVHRNVVNAHKSGPHQLQNQGQCCRLTHHV